MSLAASNDNKRIKGWYPQDFSSVGPPWSPNHNYYLIKTTHVRKMITLIGRSIGEGNLHHPRNWVQPTGTKDRAMAKRGPLYRQAN